MTAYDDRLLKAVSEFPILYNHMRSDYKNVELKTKAWEAVMKLMNTKESVDKVRLRWKSIRDSYVKYLNKLDKAPNGSKIRPYKFETQLQFLKPFLNNQKDIQQLTESDDVKFNNTDQLMNMNITQYLDDDQSSHSSVSSKKRKRNDTNSSIVVENSFSLLNQTYRTLQEMDDLDIFCLSLSQMMKKLRPLTVAKLKKEMANLITDAEIRELEEMDQYVITSDDYYKNELDS